MHEFDKLNTHEEIKFYNKPRIRLTELLKSKIEADTLLTDLEDRVNAELKDKEKIEAEAALNELRESYPYFIKNQLCFGEIDDFGFEIDELAFLTKLQITLPKIKAPLLVCTVMSVALAAFAARKGL